MKFNLKKLTSRKFWFGVIGVITPLALTFGVDGDTLAKVSGLILSTVTAVAYILGEAFVDGKRYLAEDMQNVSQEFQEK